MAKGESACMAYCLFTHNVIGSLTPAEISAFITEVKQKGSKLPEVDIEKYVCETIL